MSLTDVLEALKREYGTIPRPAEALREEYVAPSPAPTETKITLTPEQQEKIKEVLERLWEIEKKGIQKAGEVISKLFERYRKQKQLAEATGEKVDMEKIFREAGIPVKGELGVYVM